MLKQKGINLFGIAPVFKRKPEEPLLLSYAQERQWFLWQLDPDSAAYHLSSALSLDGDLNVEALERSFAALLERHEALRTTFVQHAEQTLQQIAEHVPFSLGRATLANADAAAIKAFVEAQTRSLFDLQQGPLVRATLLQVSATQHVLVIVQHHIVSDGWSMQIMVDELMRLYAAHSQGRTLELPALKIQYADYALWQRQWMEAGERDRQLAYWTAQLGGEQPVLELPLDRTRPAEQSFRGAQLGIELPVELGAGLKRLAQAEGVTLFMLLLASFQTLLHRYSGQPDIRVGVPVANRNRVETEGLIGFFVNTQILKAQFDAPLTFRALLQQVRQCVLAAQDHQDLPFEQLVDALQPQRNLSHNALFQVMYNHQGEAQGNPAAQLPGLTLAPLHWDNPTAQFDLTLNTYDNPEGLAAALTYATDLFEASTAARMGRHWLNLLQAILANPAGRIDELPLLGPAEQQATLRQWNGQPRAFPVTQCLHQMIEAQVERTPQAIALCCGEARLSYGELNERANRLAHRLIEQGVGADVRVGLAVERSLEMLVGLLAILKAGGAYVPLDPAYPSERLAYMIEDSGIGLLLTQPSLLAQLPLDGGVQCLLLSDDTSGYSPHNPQVVLTPANLAYVIYTSGSTGKPKGTLLAHHNVLRLFAATEHWFAFGPDDVWSLFHSYAFDFSVWEIFGALLYGGRLVVVPHDVSRSPEDFHALLLKEGVTVLNQTPSAFSQLMQVACAPEYAGARNALRHVVFGGEALEVKSLRPWFERFGDRQPQLTNMYGITETTVHVSYRPLRLADLAGEAGSPIGEAIPDLSWYLLDRALNPVARGCIGELYIGQAGLARGYLNRGDLTATRFVPDPFGAAGERLYRTGDLARYRADGVIEYIGRIDHQVKIRGFRIELGEIEARLQALSQVRQAVVLAQAGASGAQLVGYVVPRTPGIDPGELREALKAQLREDLPEHMVPAHLLLLEQLPLTSNGKLDRKALPQPDASLLQSVYVAPQSDLEQRLASIWQDVLKLEQVGLTDNFFELGGDSIISIQVVSRARQAGIRISPKDLFQHQTVQSLATVAQVGTAGTAPDQVALVGPTPLLPMQQLFFDSVQVQRHHWNQSVLLKPSQALDASLLERALQAVVAHHDALRLRFEQRADGWHAHAVAEPGTALLWHREAASLHELDSLGEAAQASLDLQHGSLLRGLLVDLAQGEQRLLLVIHHLAVDGVSWRILFEDLQQAYAALRDGQAVQLPPRTTSIRRWAQWLQQHARSEAVQAQLDYWQHQLQGVALALPCEHPQGDLSNRQAASVSTRLDLAQTRQLLQQAPAAYRTQVNDLLLTALARVLTRWTQAPAVALQLEGHGREELFEDQDLTRTVGWFTSVFPLKLTPAAGLGDSIKAIKQQLRAIPDKGIGFGALRYLGDEAARRALGELPTPRITFNYLGQFDASFADATALFTPCGDAAGNPQSAEAPLDNWLSINGQVYKGELELNWTFSRAMFDTARVQRLADAYGHELCLLIAHCCSPEAGGVTPSDFPLAGLEQAQLDALPIAAPTLKDLYPLSPMQQGMLFHSLYQQDSADYITQMSLEIDGLDPVRFARAWQDAVDAHDILRTAFLWQPPLLQPLQAVLRQATLSFEVHDWRERDDLAQAVAALAGNERRRGFELGHAPLLRLHLVQSGAQRYHLIYTHHHILMDGWSNSQLLGEVLQRYCGQAPQVAVGNYSDYIAWLQRQDRQRSEAFWGEQLRDLQEPTRLARVSTPAGDGYANHYLTLQAVDTGRLQRFAREQKVTVNTLLQAAWLLLLQRYTGQACVAFGATVAGRPAELKGVEQHIGLFINTLPVVASPRPELTVGQWLQQVQAQNLSLREHEHTPLFEVQRWAGKGGEALFDNILVFENYPVAEVLEQAAPEGLRFGAMEQHEQTNYPLTLAVGLGDELSLHMSYDLAHFAPATIEQIAAQLGHLLLAMPSAADRPLGTLALMEQAEQREVLAEWNPAPAQFASQRCLHELIEAQAARAPSSIALTLGDAQLSYRELNERANQMAHALIAQGIGPEVLVGLACERSLEMVVGLLAILKAGGAYVPLDPAYPEDRLAYMMEDSGLSVVLAQSHLQLPVPQGVGEPIPDLSWYLLDADLNPVPKGAIGELYVGQAGLARGYLKRADLTATRFVPDPFSARGERLYRTGDLARYRQDGIVEYVGRIDHQVKIRGFRIELGEIEARLAQQAAVREALVLAVDGPSGQQLVGYVVPQDASAEHTQLRDQLKAGLKAELPDYMVPTHLLFLEQWPLTANGKLDRRALPAPDASLLQAEYVAPQGELEQQIAALWQQMLGCERIGRTDDFFELGGHSLLATQVISRVRQVLGFDVALRTLFEHSRLADFVATLDALKRIDEPALVAVERGVPLPLSYAQERQWFLWQLDPQSSAYHLPAALRLRGPLDVPALQRSFDALVARHEPLRTRFVQVDAHVRQVIDPAAPLPIDFEVLAHVADRTAQIQASVAAESSRLFALDQGPLLRVKLLRLAEDDHVLVLTQHHIVSDGWSMQVMIDELIRRYGAGISAQELVLPELPIQYADFAQWQRQWLEAGERERQLRYWLEQLGGEQPTLQLPTDRAHPAQRSFHGARRDVALDAGLTRGLLQLARECGVTPFMLLLASFQALLHRYSGQDDIRVGVPVANRNRLETEGLIGFFVNTLVLKAHVSGRQAFTVLLEQVRQATLQAHAHQDLPFEQLVEALQPGRNLGRSPLFQVLFNYQAQTRNGQGLQPFPHLQVEALQWDTHTAQFDLSLEVFEREEGIAASLTFATDVFEAHTIEQMLGHWQNLLRAIVERPQQRVGELPLLDAREQQANLQQWNPAPAQFASQRCLHELIEAQAARAPGSIALTLGDTQLSYRELNERANQMAHALIAQGIGPEVLVGLACERSLEMVVGLLAILKAGGAYVPLDPAYPEDRLAYMMEDSGLSVVLAQSHLGLPTPAGVRTLLLDDDFTGYAASNPGLTLDPANLAYVIYTSGSTGKPKGALLAHHNVLRLFAATEHWVTSMAASVGPYRLYRPAFGNLANTCCCASTGRASPLQTMRVRLVQRGTPASSRKACSIDGTKCRVLTWCWLISATSLAGSRWSPGAATTRRAPVISGQKNSHTDTSKLNGVFCSTVSLASRA
ncbi:hypothetical protein CR917_20785 [Pseudomonas sp. BRM28]|nr:hypothetical protein CR917_20785 [Pseudomonas sp. BRM28]